MTENIVIIGIGGSSIDIIEMIEEMNKTYNHTYNILGFLDDNLELINKNIHGYKVIGTLKQAKEFDKSVKFIFSIGSERTYHLRESIFKNLNIPLERFTNIIHPTSIISSSAIIESGAIIFPNVYIGSNVTIGIFCTFLPNVVINHNSNIGNFTICASNANISGGVSIESSVYVGGSASLKNEVVIKSGALIGLGSVVIKDVEENSIVVGNPTKTIGYVK